MVGTCWDLTSHTIENAIGSARKRISCTIGNGVIGKTPGYAVVGSPVGEASVLENLRIGRFRTKAGWRIDWRREHQAASAALASFGIDASPEQRTLDLDEVDRAMLAILRGLQGLPADRPGILILDEPTAHLPRDGVDRVFAAIRRVAAADDPLHLRCATFCEAVGVALRYPSLLPALAAMLRIISHANRRGDSRLISHAMRATRPTGMNGRRASMPAMMMRAAASGSM